jgi:hypothetical protein
MSVLLILSPPKKKVCFKLTIFVFNYLSFHGIFENHAGRVMDIRESKTVTPNLAQQTEDHEDSQQTV